MISYIWHLYRLNGTVHDQPRTAWDRLADRVGQRRIYLSGWLLVGLSSLAAGFAPSLIWLLVARAIQGASGAMLFGNTMAIVASVFPPTQRGQPISFVSMAAGLAYSLVLAGNSCLHNDDWSLSSYSPQRHNLGSSGRFCLGVLSPFTPFVCLKRIATYELKVRAMNCPQCKKLYRKH